MNRHIVSISFDIDHPGQSRQVAIRVPADAHRIIGVETSVRAKDGMEEPIVAEGFLESFDVLPARQFGTLRLAQPGCHGLFYASAVKEPNYSVGFADFSAHADFIPLDTTHGFLQQEDPIEIPKTSGLITAIYTDTQGNSMGGSDFSYLVSVHLWYETNSEKL